MWKDLEKRIDYVNLIRQIFEVVVGEEKLEQIFDMSLDEITTDHDKHYIYENLYEEVGYVFDNDLTELMIQTIKDKKQGILSGWENDRQLEEHNERQVEEFKKQMKEQNELKQELERSIKEKRIQRDQKINDLIQK